MPSPGVPNAHSIPAPGPFGSAPQRSPLFAPVPPPMLLGGPAGAALTGNATAADRDDGFLSKAASAVGRVLVVLILVVAAGAGYVLFRDANHVEIAAEDMPEVQVPRPVPPIAPPAPEVPINETPAEPAVEEPPATTPPDVGHTQVQTAPPIEVPATEAPPTTAPPPAPEPPPGAVEFSQSLDAARDAHNEIVELLATTTVDPDVLLLPADPAVVAEIEALLDEFEAAVGRMSQYGFPAESRAADILETVREIHALQTEELELRTDPAWPTLKLLTRYDEATDEHTEKVNALNDELIPAWISWVESQMYG